VLRVELHVTAPVNVLVVATLRVPVLATLLAVSATRVVEPCTVRFLVNVVFPAYT
jgi:hypothetical protein